MSHVEELRAFNQKWLGMHLGGRFPEGVVAHLPAGENACADIHDLVLRMVSCFVQPAVSVDKFEQLASGWARQTGVKSLGPLASACLLKEWLFLARLKSKDVLSGRYSSLRHMHLDWRSAGFFASLSNAQIQAISLKAGSEKQVVLKWAWPEHVFAASATVHPSLFGAWAFALTA